ncbi:hypothetical protein [Caballeronia sordidicola]|uniref:hypothetical protein n=1 Tax=Caballeronia sordidicola TaxID=196367 RepID=UPI0009F8426E|nr:hypothetical protein [Caballeronia sordidicola]
MPYLLGWLLGVPVIVLVILYLIFHWVTDTERGVSGNHHLCPGHTTHLLGETIFTVVRVLNPLSQAQANIRRWKAIANFFAPPVLVTMLS